MIGSTSGSPPGGSQTATAAKPSSAQTVLLANASPAKAETNAGKCVRYWADSGNNHRSTGSMMNAETSVATTRCRSARSTRAADSADKSRVIPDDQAAGSRAADLG